MSSPPMLVSPFGLVDLALKSAAVMLLVCAAAALLGRASAAQRHLVWCLGVASLMLMPALSLALPAWRANCLPQWTAEQTRLAANRQAALAQADHIEPLDARSSTAVVLSPSVVAAATDERNSPAAAAIKTASSPLGPFPWLAIGWAAGVLLSLVPLAVGLWQLAALKRRSRLIDDPRWLALLDELRRQMAVRRGVQLRQNATTLVPLTCGALRPVLLVPAEASAWPDERRRLVLLHELAHVRRWDWLTQLMAHVEFTLYWFNPLVWLAARQMQIERERACDDLVLASGARATDYAQELFALAAGLSNSQLSTLVAVPMARRGALEDRLRGILDDRRRRAALTKTAVCLATALAAVIIAPLAMLRAAPLTPPAAKRVEPNQTLPATEVERRVMALYDRVGPAIVRWTAPDRGGVGTGGTGVIVTAEGHILVSAVAAGTKLTFQLSDGRNATGTTLGWSGEWNVGLAKLDGQGPWPHVELGGSASIRAGQGVVTLGYASDEPPGLVQGAFLSVGSVITAAPGLWFTTSDLSVPPWRDASIVFNLDGSLAGVGWTLYWTSGWYGHGRFYTDAKVVRTLWDDLASGKNRDLVRLRRPDLRDREEPDGTDRDEKKAIPQAAEKKASAVTVRIRRGRFLDEQRPWGSGPGDHDLSGVIVSADGIVATCAHHFVVPGKEVTVCLPDGRDAPAKVLGINPVCDISLMRILEPGPWPFVELGDSLRMRPGDPCLFIGYGPVENQDRQPSTRTSSVAASETGQWEYLLGTDPSTTLISGDSGGGIFDADGRLLAIHHGTGSLPGNGRKLPHMHVRVEVFREHWEELNATLDRTNASSLATAEGDLKQAAHGVGQSVVEVLDGHKSVAVGTVVGRDGQILTKASLLPEAPACRLFDGRVFPAAVVKTIREHDLAILKIGAENLPVAEWSGDNNPRTGTILAVTRAGGELAVGFVSHPEISIPPERGDLWVNVRDSPQGLEIVEVYRATGGLTKLHNTMLQKGDVILTVDGHPTPDLKAYRQLFYPQEGDPVAIAGDQLRLAIAREGKKLELLQLLDPAEVRHPNGRSPRYSGFDRAYNVNVDTKSPLGGPVVNRTGRVLGVAIAWRAQGWLLVLPRATAKTIIEETERD